MAERKIETMGQVRDDGSVRISYKEKWLESIKSNFPAGTRFRLVAQRLYNRRSTKTWNDETGEEGGGQNGYYWFVVVHEFCEGYLDTYGEICTKARAHSTLKQECNFREIVNPTTGAIRREARSTADMTTVEFEEYLERCRVWIKEWFGRTVLLPNEQAELELTQQQI